MGWHEDLLKRLLDQYQGKRDTVCPDQLFRDSGTSNYQHMAAGAELLRSHRWGKPAEKSAAVAVALGLLARNREQGHLLLEQGCPDPHYGMHAAGLAAMHTAALEFGLEDVLAGTTAWWEAHHRYLAACVTPDGGWLSPGFRFEGEPVNTVASAVYRLLDGALPQRWGRNAVPLANDQAARKWEAEPAWYLGPLFLRRILRVAKLGAGPSAEPALPALRASMHVRRCQGGYVSYLDRPTYTPRGGWLFPVSWVAVEYGGRVRYEREWKSDPPAVDLGDLLADLSSPLPARPVDPEAREGLPSPIPPPAEPVGQRGRRRTRP